MSRSCSLPSYIRQAVTIPEEDFTRTVTALQYQKVMTENDITHCLHGVPYEPNCGGFYP
jgi:hypothetical protein